MTVAFVSLLVVFAGVLGGIWEVAATRRERERERRAAYQPRHAVQRYQVKRRLTIQSDTLSSLPRPFVVGYTGRSA